MIDTIGSGIRRIFTIQKKRFFRMPDYTIENNRVIVTVTGKVLDIAYCQKMILDYLKKFKSASRYEFEKIILNKLPDVLDENQKTNKIKNVLQDLNNQGVIVLGSNKKWRLTSSK